MCRGESCEVVIAGGHKLRPKLMLHRFDRGPGAAVLYNLQFAVDVCSDCTCGWSYSLLFLEKRGDRENEQMILHKSWRVETKVLPS